MSRNIDSGSDISKQSPRAAVDVNFSKLVSEHHAESRSSVENPRRSTNGKVLKDREKRAGTHDASGDGSSGSRGSGNIPRRTQTKKHRAFLLDSLFTNGRPHTPDSAQRQGKSHEPNGHVKQSAVRNSRLSTDSAQRSSPLSQEMSVDEKDDMDMGSSSTSSRPPSMDPAQLVQMALSLSENRKRHVSNLPVPVSPAGGRRVGSALDSGYGTVRSAGSDKRASYLSDTQRRDSLDSRGFEKTDADHVDSLRDGENVLYTFSPATLSRAEKARRYFELACEHRRLLDHLPPLKSDSTAPENYSVQATSSPGSAHYDMTRIHSGTNNKRGLGRPYNPLQALRNRRLRNRQRRTLTAPPESWQETDRIKRWIDDIEEASKDPSYRPGKDQVRLPEFSRELEGDGIRPETANHRHRRTDTASSVITRPENGWTIEPAELLADTYWVEKDDNKTSIEDRHGHKIFQARERVSRESAPRKSRESERGNGYMTDRHSHHEASEDDDRVRHRYRNRLPIPARLRRSHISRADSVSSASSDEGRKPLPSAFASSEGGDVNIGPLERHMRSMIDQDERGELSSPELISPDHWDSKHTPFPASRQTMEDSQRGSMQRSHHRLSADMTGHKRSRSADVRMGSVDHGMSSMDSDSPNSPILPVFVASSTTDLVASQSKRISPTEQKAKRRSHIPIFRSRSKERSHVNQVNQTDFATGIGKPLSPVMSADTSAEQPAQSLDSVAFEHFGQNNTPGSASSSLHRLNTSIPAPESSVKDPRVSASGRRFFKGGRIGELVRNEGSRLGDRLRGSREKLGESGVIVNNSRPRSEISDVDDHPYTRRRVPTDDTIETDDQVSPRESLDSDRPPPKFYTSNLPSFKSPYGRNRRSIVGTPMSEMSDPFSRPQGDSQANQPGRLAPPKINLPEDDSVSESDLTRERSGRLPGNANDSARRQSASQNNLTIVPSNISIVSHARRNDDFPVTGLAGHEAKRHWSISDQALPRQATRVTTRDIARLRALLLASGIKAHELYVKAESPRDEPLPLMLQAAQTAGQVWVHNHVSRKEEPVIAARMLSRALETTNADFEHSLQHFQAHTIKSLADRLESLSHRASEQLTTVLTETSDEADAFHIELTTKQPQEVKRVDEAVDAMFRQRRRQFRLARRTGFKLLEWMVLGLMWWVWFVVFLFNLVRRATLGFLAGLRWLLWF